MRHASIDKKQREVLRGLFLDLGTHALSRLAADFCFADEVPSPAASTPSAYADAMLDALERRGLLRDPVGLVVAGPDRGFFDKLASLFPSFAARVRSAESEVLGPLVHMDSDWIPSPVAEGAARLLDRTYNTRSKRRGILQEAGIQADPGLAWPAILTLLGPQQLLALLRAARSDQADDASDWDRLVEMAEVSALGERASDGLGSAFDEKIEAGGLLLREGRYEEAAAHFEALLGRCEDLGPSDEAWRLRRARVQLNLASALMPSGGMARARELLRAVDLPEGEAARRVTLGRLRARAGELAAALQAVEGIQDRTDAEAVRQLVALRRGEPPAVLVHDSEVQLEAATLFVNARRAASGASAAERAVAAGGLNAVGLSVAAGILFLSLAQTILDIGLEPVPVEDRGRFLELANRLRREATDHQGLVWRQALRARAMVEQIPAPPDDGQAGDPRDRAGPMGECPWLSEFDEAAALSAEALNESILKLEDLNRRWPARMLVLLALSRACRRADRPARAIAAAREAFQQMPGRGQRLELATALAEASRPEEAWELLAPFESDEPDDDWYSLAIHASAVAAPQRQLSLAEAWTRRSVDRAAPWAALAQVRLLAGDRAGAREASLKALSRDLSRLSLRGLQACAAGLTASGEAGDPAEAQALLAELERRVVDQPEAEALRFGLLMALGAPAGARPVNWERLVSVEAAWTVPRDQLPSVLRAQAQLRAGLDRLFIAGAICAQTWVTERGEEQGIVALGARRGEIKIPPPLPPSRPRSGPWRGATVLVGVAELEILAGLKLLSAFAEAVHRVAVFEDTHMWITNALVDVTARARREELQWLHEVMRLVAARRRHAGSEPESGWARVPHEQIPDLQGWLARSGYLAGAQISAWSPPARLILDAGVVVSARSFGLELLLHALDQEGITVEIDQDGIDLFNRRISELDLRQRAADLACDTARWMGELHAAGRLIVLRLPTFELPLLRPGVDPEVDEITRRAFAPRFALAEDPQLTLICGEASALGVDGTGPPALMEVRLWTEQSIQALRARMEQVVPRAFTLAEVIRDLDPKQLRAYARTGAVDALGPDQLLHLFRDYHGLSGAEPRRCFEAQGWFLAQDRQPSQGWASFWLTSRVWAQSLWDVWMGADLSPEERSRFVPELLDAVARLETSLKGRYRLLEGTFAGLVTLSLADPEQFYLNEAKRALLSQDTPGGTLWTAVGAWAVSAHERVMALQMGVGLALMESSTYLPGLPRNRPLIGVLIGVVAATPARPDRDLDQPMYAALSQLPVGMQVLDTLSAKGELSLGERLRMAIQRLKTDSTFELDGLRLSLDGDPPTHVPVEAVLSELPAPEATFIAKTLQPHDARLASAVLHWFEHKDLSSEQALRLALRTSPLRRVRADPRVILSWTPHWDRGAGFPGSAGELLELLGEASDIASERPLQEVLQSRLAEGGIWHDPEFYSEIAPQLACLPGLICTDGPTWSADTPVSELLPDLRAGEHRPAGRVAVAVRSLAHIAASAPIHGDVDLREEVPSLLARLFEAPPRDSYAELEPALVRAAGEVVHALAPFAPPHASVWLSWRLYGWLEAQLREAEHPGDAARALAAIAPPPVPSQGCPGDLYDPRRMGPGRVDLRELMLLQALLSILVAPEVSEINWAPLLPILRRIATRPLMPDEQVFRTSWPEPSLGGPALVAPDLALLLLLRLDPDALESMTETQRLGRLADALNHGTDAVGPHTLVLAAFVEHPERWTVPERERIALALQEPSKVPPQVLPYLLAGAWFAGAEGLRARAFEAALDAVGQEEGPMLAAYALTAAARQGALRALVAALRQRCEAQKTDPRPYLRGLARALVHAGPEGFAAAAEMLRAVVQDPETGEDPVMKTLFQLIEAEDADGG